MPVDPRDFDWASILDRYGVPLFLLLLGLVALAWALKAGWVLFGPQAKQYQEYIAYVEARRVEEQARANRAEDRLERVTDALDKLSDLVMAALLPRKDR